MDERIFFERIVKRYLKKILWNSKIFYETNIDFIGRRREDMRTLTRNI